jgi:hypothetical protein
MNRREEGARPRGATDAVSARRRGDRVRRPTHDRDLARREMKIPNWLPKWPDKDLYLVLAVLVGAPSFVLIVLNVPISYVLLLGASASLLVIKWLR